MGWWAARWMDSREDKIYEEVMFEIVKLLLGI